MNLPVLSEPRNVKLGCLIHSWSLPAGRARSCPGESGLCRVRCYAKRGHFHQPNVKKAHRRNFDYSKTDGFVDWLVGSSRATFARVLRIHVSGDFYDVDYTRKWYEIAKLLPNVQLFTYTRSWREEAILPELLTLSTLSNFQLWWSIDRETGPAPLIRGIRRAYMAIDDVDAECAPDDCDLVFRAQRATVMKKANGIVVCPAENGIARKPKATCSDCEICWNQHGPVKTCWEEHLQPTVVL